MHPDCVQCPHRLPQTRHFLKTGETGHGLIQKAKEAGGFILVFHCFGGVSSQHKSLLKILHFPDLLHKMRCVSWQPWACSLPGWWGGYRKHPTSVWEPQTCFTNQHTLTQKRIQNRHSLYARQRWHVNTFIQVFYAFYGCSQIWNQELWFTVQTVKIHASRGALHTCCLSFMCKSLVLSQTQSGVLGFSGLALSGPVSVDSHKRPCGTTSIPLAHSSTWHSENTHDFVPQHQESK